MTVTKFLDRRDGPQLAYVRTQAAPPGDGLPGVVFLGGFRSDMQGTKALFLEQQCRARGQAYLRFDYSGHGQSSGRFEERTIEDWRDDALAVVDRLTAGPVILAGSSMGGWLALLLALARPDRVCGVVGIAAAPDFTRDMVARFDDVMQASYDSRGYAAVPSAYSDTPYIITRALIESGNRLCLLDGRHDMPIPVRLVQGCRDDDVPADRPQAIAACLIGADLAIHMVDDGDHRLSRPEDLALIDSQIVAINGLFPLV